MIANVEGSTLYLPNLEKTSPEFFQVGHFHFCPLLFFFFCLFVCTSYFVVFLSYQTNILWLTSSWRQKLCVLEKGSDFSNVDYLILGPPTRFVIFCFFPSLEGRLSSELQLHRHRVV